LLIQKYNPEWNTMFREIKDIIEFQLTGFSITVEHIGSTSVPALAAKPIIDIDIVFKNDIEFSDLTKMLNKIGCEHNGDQGISGREEYQKLKFDISQETGHDQKKVCKIERNQSFVFY
jgi:GrpB-like predicted nucleotidyltransferase (UPF0157 family)